jgi:acetyl esterase/lipase
VSTIPKQPPLAETVSVEARAALTPFLAMSETPMPLPDIGIARAMTAALLQPIAEARMARYGVEVKPCSMGGIPVQIVRKTSAIDDPAGSLLINLHGGGFEVDSGSLTESIPIAGLTGLPVAAVLYRLAPENPYPAAVDDALAVYREALKERPASKVAVYGTSAGAGLTMQLLARLKRERLPLPAACGVFSGSGDFATIGDIEAYLPPLMGGKPVPETLARYRGSVDPRDPLLSPLYGDLTGLPPTLLMSSTRDLLLSQTVRLHLAMRKAGSPVDLEVYEGMPHAFWAYVECPETDNALAAQAAFLARHV